MACRVIDVFSAAFLLFTIELNKLLFQAIWVDFSVVFVNIKYGRRYLLCALMALKLL